MNVTLVYGFDPLCGWCFGFAPALRRIRAEFTGLPIEVRMGGLITGNRIRPYMEAAAYITQASARLRAVTGVSLGQSFHTRILANPAVISSSVPPCDVLLQLRAEQPDAVLDVAEALQRAHFGNGLDLNDHATYAGIARELGITLNMRIPAPDAVRPELAAEFAAVRALGITSYPSLILDRDGELTPVELSYDPATAVSRIGSMLG
jgi:putative protein-disulfide isomerase